MANELCKGDLSFSQSIDLSGEVGERDIKMNNDWKNSIGPDQFYKYVKECIEETCGEYGRGMSPSALIEAIGAAELAQEYFNNEALDKLHADLIFDAQNNVRLCKDREALAPLMYELLYLASHEETDFIDYCDGPLNILDEDEGGIFDEDQGGYVFQFLFDNVQYGCRLVDDCVFIVDGSEKVVASGRGKNEQRKPHQL